MTRKHSNHSVGYRILIPSSKYQNKVISPHNIFLDRGLVVLSEPPRAHTPIPGILALPTSTIVSESPSEYPALVTPCIASIEVPTTLITPGSSASPSVLQSPQRRNLSPDLPRRQLYLAELPLVSWEQVSCIGSWYHHIDVTSPNDVTDSSRRPTRRHNHYQSPRSSYLQAPPSGWKTSISIQRTPSRPL
jgi:hypothetical protein